MLSPFQRVARDILRTPKARMLSQRELSSQAGFQQPYLAQVEKGVRPISLRAAERLEIALKLKAGRLSKLLRNREFRRLWRESRAALKDFGRGIRQFVEDARKPRVQQPHQRMTLENPLWPMAVHLGAEAAE